MTTVLVIAGILLCVILSGFFSGSEMAFSSVNKMRLESEKEEGNKQAATALYIAEHFDDALSTILIGNNLVNIACSSLGSVAVILILKNDGYTWVSTVIITILVIIFGETIPKIICKKTAVSFAERFAYPVRFLMFILKPLVLLVVGLVKLITMPLRGTNKDSDADEAVEELQSIIETAEEEEILDENQSELVQAAIDFADISAMEAMTSRVDTLAVNIDDDWADIVGLLEKAPYTRIPVYEGTIDNIIGILHMNNFLKAMTEDLHPDLRTLLRKPCYVYKTMKLPEVLAEFRKVRQHIAVVVDEYGGTLGIISVEDVLEKMVGDIWDETDVVQEEIVRKKENEYEIDGDMPISEFLDLMEIKESAFDGESETVGGWTIETFGRFPAAGESFHYENFTVMVLAMDERRVEKVLVRIDEPEEEKESE